MNVSFDRSGKQQFGRHGAPEDWSSTPGVYPAYSEGFEMIDPYNLSGMVEAKRKFVMPATPAFR
jgi:hypothetical protein